ncbi:MAG: hypothetical protein U1D25_13110, partial [Hydrogenophaga sp.]|nr:hypothetical protein [Hydrogenophaga sp.]
MKLRLNKLMAGLVMAGGAVALVGCGGGDAPTLVVKANSVTSITNTPAAVATTKVLVEAATGAAFTLPALSFDNAVSTSAAAAAPVGAVLEISTATPAAGTITAATIAAFKITAPTGAAAGEVNGVVDAGSCRFRVTSSTGVFAASWVVGQIYVKNPCQITLPVANAAVGATVQTPVNLTLGTSTVTATNKTVTVTVTPGTGNTATISVGGSTITVEPLPT